MEWPATIERMRSRERSPGGVLRVVLPLLLVGTIVVVFLPMTPAYDVDVFLRAGYAALHSLPVYPAPGTPAVYSGSSFVYPYFAVWLFAPLAALPTGVGAALFFAISAGAVMAACLLAAGSGPLRATLVLCSAFTITGLQLGALSPLLFVGALFLWRLRGRPVALALLAAPVVASKLFLVALLAWLALARRYRAFAWAGALTLALLGAGFLLGPLAPGQYLQLLSQLGAHEAGSGFGLIGALMNAGLPPAAAQGVAVAVAAGLMGAAYLRYRRSGDERLLFCAGILASLVLTPVLWSHYLVLLPAILLLLDASWRWLVVLALASWAISPPHGVPDAGLVQPAALAATAVSLLWFACSASLARRLGPQRGEGVRAPGEPA